MADTIPIRNIYYMLAYAFRFLDQKDFSGLDTEPFTGAADLFAAILAKGLSGQLRSGLEQNYIRRSEALQSPRGRIDVSATVKQQSLPRRTLCCRYDEYSQDILLNQVFKLTARLLCASRDVSPGRRDSLKRLLPFLNHIRNISPGDIRWELVSCRRDNHSGRSMAALCKMVLEDLLFTAPDGTRRLAGYMDGQPMHRLYEKFILAYYQRHFPSLTPAPEQIRWDTDALPGSHLPIMSTDVTLHGMRRTLVIDAKYYSRSMQNRQDYGSPTLHSDNLYQIYAYVKNLDRNHTGNVGGLLLYARTDETVYPQYAFNLGGNQIGAGTLDLSLPFEEIAAQLDKITLWPLDKSSNPWNTSI